MKDPGRGLLKDGRSGAKNNKQCNKALIKVVWNVTEGVSIVINQRENGFRMFCS